MPDQPPDHGTRAGYKGGCRCLLCRAAEATYQRTRYKLRQMGRVTAGCRLNAQHTWAQVRWLLREQYTRSDLARFLGRQTREFNIGRRVVTAKTAARIATLYRHHASMDVGMGEKS